MTINKRLFDKFIKDTGLSMYTDKHHDNLLGGPNSDPIPTTTPDMDAYIHHVDTDTRVVITTAYGIVTVMVYHRNDIPMAFDTINFASRDYLSQLHVITNADQCDAAVQAVKPVLNDPVNNVLQKVS